MRPSLFVRYNKIPELSLLRKNQIRKIIVTALFLLPFEMIVLSTMIFIFLQVSTIMLEKKIEEQKICFVFLNRICVSWIHTLSCKNALKIILFCYTGFIVIR